MGPAQLLIALWSKSRPLYPTRSSLPSLFLAAVPMFGGPSFGPISKGVWAAPIGKVDPLVLPSFPSPRAYRACVEASRLFFASPSSLRFFSSFLRIANAVRFFVVMEEFRSFARTLRSPLPALQQTRRVSVFFDSSCVLQDVPIVFESQVVFSSIRWGLSLPPPPDDLSPLIYYARLILSFPFLGHADRPCFVLGVDVMRGCLADRLSRFSHSILFRAMNFCPFPLLRRRRDAALPFSV